MNKHIGARNEVGMKIDEVIVVEGRSDTVAIKRAVEADTIETNGSAVGEVVLKQIELAYKRRGVIIFTDPDYPGNRIRHIVSERVPGCKHAFIPKADAVRANRSLGVEHASDEAIRSALLAVRTETIESFEQEITMEDLMKAKLVSGAGARKKREILGERLAIGYANGKQLLKRLQTFRITADEFNEALKELDN
ncbi:ribonuclease M5 [Bacillus sp. JCM 19046]|nr:ribonuclease M5 [Bacillus sp. JCM 19045]GAF17706.1 ribonuclease M5 [Bacillus sp. JCM 19046]